ncbi:MAG TPA: glycosyltransferase family 4 protein [Cyclobacteriaceae bacterium]
MKKKPSIVMLANGHSPFDTRIFLKEAVSLSREGFNVSIIVPNKSDDERDDIKIIAVPLVSKGWQKLVVTPWRIFIKARKQSKDSIFHIHDSDILIVGVLLKILGRRVIYDAHEDTPLQISYQHWLPTVVKIPYRWFYYVLEKICGIIFNKIIVAEPVIAKYFPVRKTTLIRNFPMADAFKRESVKPYKDRASRLVSVGTLTKVRGLYEMLEGADRAKKTVDFEFVLGGKFAPAELEQKTKATYSFTFLSWISHRELVDLLFDSRIGIIIPHPIERYKTNYPVKLFEFMAAGIPVIASKAGESALFVNEAQCGILVDPLNVKEIADAIVWLFQHAEEAEAMGKRGQKLIFEKYNWEKESENLLEVYKNFR